MLVLLQKINQIPHGGGLWRPAAIYQHDIFFSERGPPLEPNRYAANAVAVRK